MPSLWPKEEGPADPAGGVVDLKAERDRIDRERREKAQRQAAEQFLQVARQYGVDVEEEFLALLRGPDGSLEKACAFIREIAAGKV